MCIDMCIGMYIDMWTDMCIDMWTCLCTDMWTDMCIDMWRECCFVFVLVDLWDGGPKALSGLVLLTERPEIIVVHHGCLRPIHHLMYTCLRPIHQPSHAHMSMVSFV